MLALVIALFLIAAVLGHLVRDRKGAQRDREFYEELIAHGDAQQAHEE